MNERRRLRSEDPSAALGHLFSALALRHRIDAVALSDDAGEVLASAGTIRPQRLADAGRKTALGDADAATDDVTGGADLYARAISVGDSTMIVTSLGGRVPRLHDTARAIARILR